jgi:hypothetical protein
VDGERTSSEGRATSRGSNQEPTLSSPLNMRLVLAAAGAMFIVSGAAPAAAVLLLVVLAALPATASEVDPLKLPTTHAALGAAPNASSSTAASRLSRPPRIASFLL